MSAKKTALLWFRQDLRLRDNPALLHAVENGYKIIPVFILDDENAKDWKHGGASRWWLHRSLEALNESLSKRMVFRKGNAADILPELIKQSGASSVFWSRCYEPWRIARDKAIKTALKDAGITAETFNATLLWEPWEVQKDDGTPYKVFTPFYRRGCVNAGEPPAPKPAPKSIAYADFKATGSLDDLDILPRIQWYAEMAKLWQPGEEGAQKRLKTFLQDGLGNYKEGRNRPDWENISRLSPHLHFGEISPRQAWHDAIAAGAAQNLESDTDCFCSELGWREFAHSLLYYNPDMPEQPLQKKFEDFPWDKNDAALAAWQTGQTGIPIVDAGMRQLWRTGWMHNRVRMIVGSLLVKNLRLPWQEGERWFWDTLVDADLANNACGWQWIAGCGADAAPYFRVFNPVSQGEKFDPNGDYVREFVPELKEMPAKYIHAPWDAPPLVLREASVTLGQTYPLPITDLKASRDEALEAFKSIKSA